MARSKKKSGGDGWVLIKECPKCRRPESDCTCGSSSDEPAVVRMRMEKRRGKPVTVLAASAVGGARLKEWLKALKTQCATGGSLKGSELELQGEHRDRARDYLEKQGVRVKG